MFTTTNFLKLFIALLLAASANFQPIIGDLAELVGGGLGAEIVAFVILLLFSWFLVSKSFEFLAFAFGGGVGRYNTTKLYRRMQLLTFCLFMTLPVFVLVTLVVATTPLSGHTDAYIREVARIEAIRLAAAEDNQRSRYRSAVAARLTEISNARRDRGIAIQVAQRRRELDIEIANADREKAIEASLQSQRMSIREERDAALAETEQNSGPIALAIREITDQDRDYASTVEQLEAEVRTYLRIAEREWQVEDKFYNRLSLIATYYGQLSFVQEYYVDVDCASYFNGENYSDLKKLPERDICILFFKLIDYDTNVRNSDGDIVSLPRLREIGRDIEKLAELLPKQAQELEEQTEQIVAEFEDKLANVKHVIPPLDMSQFPEVNEADFPEINEADFPIVQLSSFPLYLDESPIDVEDPYEGRITPTFLKHYAWMAVLSFAIWLIILENTKPVIARFYARIIRVLDEGRFGSGGSARFATMFEEWRKPYAEKTLYMGRSLYNPFDEVGLDGEAHMITVAGSRGGKGTTAIIPNLLLWEGSCVVVDPKGTNAHVTAEARRKMGHDVYLIDPFGIVTDDSDRFDPLEALDPDDDLVRERIASISDALVVRDENAKDPHWDDGALTILSGLISHVLSGQSGEEKWLYAIRDLIKRLPEDQDRMWAEMAFNEGAGGYAKDAAMRYIRGSETNEILGILSNADKHTEWLSSPVMRQVTSNPTFKLSDLKEKPTTVYLIIPPRQLTKQKRLIRLFINLMLDAMEHGGRSKTPVLMMIDEFLALDRMPEIPTAFATMASYNLVIWLFIQDLMGLQKKYKDEFNAFIANSRAMQVFSTSDDVTKDYVSKRMGNRPLISLGSITKANDNVPLRSPDDIEKDLKAEERRQYIIEAGSSAMIIEKVPYYQKRSRFAGKYAPDPDFVE